MDFSQQSPQNLQKGAFLFFNFYEVSQQTVFAVSRIWRLRLIVKTLAIHPVDESCISLAGCLLIFVYIWSAVGMALAGLL